MVEQNCIITGVFHELGEYYENGTLKKQRIIIKYSNPKSTNPTHKHPVVLLAVGDMVEKIKKLVTGDIYRFEFYPTGVEKNGKYFTDLKILKFEHAQV